MRERTLAAGVVSFTRGSTRRYDRSRTSLRAIAGDLYSYGLAAGCVLACVVSLAFALRGEITENSPSSGGIVGDRWQVIPAPVLLILLTYSALAGFLRIARRLGPITVGAAEGTWWLPLPVDRAPMVLPGFVRRVVAVGLGGAGVFLPLSFLTVVERPAAEHLLASATFGTAGIVAVALAAVQQLGTLDDRRSNAVAAVVLALLALLPALTPSLWALALSACCALALTAYLVPRVNRVPGAELVRGGAVSGHAGASLYFMDTSELLRALAGAPRPGRTGRASGFYLRRTGSAMLALVKADVVAFRRLHAPTAAALGWLAACLAAVLTDPGLPAVFQLAVLVIAGCATASGMGAVARKTALVPELDAMLPLAPSAVRASRMLMPAITLALWMVALTGCLVMLGASGPSLILLGALSGLGMGAGVIRGATRPASDWSVLPVETPFGSIPGAQVSSLLRGVDATVLAMIPLVLTLYLGSLHPAVFLLQAVVSAGAVLSVMFASPAPDAGRRH